MTGVNLMNFSDLPVVTKRPTVPAAEEIFGLYFPVLDHGFVSLVDYMGGDSAIEQAARVAYGVGTRKATETRGLIRYLHRHRHTSPMEMCELKFHCAMPIFVARQWIRHRTANVNEMSGRYSLLPMQFYTPDSDQLRPQSKTNKQGREDVSLDEGLRDIALQKWAEQRQDAVANYEWLTQNDFARELARIDLPLSTYTQWYWKIDLHNLLHFLTLRVDAHAQWEIQQYGKIMAGMLRRVAPIAYESWIDYEVCGVRLSRMELNLLRRHIDKNAVGGIMFHGAMTFFESTENMLAAGLTPREVEEFVNLFAMRTTEQDHPDFELDLTTAKSPEYFEELAKAAAPASK
jgi:thymidylate synthase (FAD)